MEKNNENKKEKNNNHSKRRTRTYRLKCAIPRRDDRLYYYINKNKRTNTNVTTVATTMVIISLALIVGFGTNALALSDSERYDVGHHEGALQAAHDKVWGGVYNDDCQRYDNSHIHTDVYCQGYYAGYDYNWSHLRNDITVKQSINAHQETSQTGQINCILAICGKNSISQRSSEQQNIDNG